MVPISFNSPTMPLLLMLCSIAIVRPHGTEHSPAKRSVQSTPRVPVYLPPGENEASVLSVTLAHLGEPSLLEAAKNANVVSFRVSFFSPVPTREVAVRLILNADGTGEITSAISADGDTEVKRTKNNVARADVEKLLLLVQQAEFWSTPRTEESADERARKAYVLDGAWWMLEGLRSGSFYYVFRRNPRPSPITEIGCYLAKELVKSAEHAIPMAGCISHSQSKGVTTPGP